jgi:hypothetical protein
MNVEGHVQIADWVSWAKARLEAQRVVLAGLEKDHAENHRLLNKTAARLAETEEALAGLRALERLRTSVETMEPGARVGVVGQPQVRGTIDTVVISRNQGVQYSVSYWHEGRLMSALLPAECVTHDPDEVLPLRQRVTEPG